MQFKLISPISLFLAATVTELVSAAYPATVRDTGAVGARDTPLYLQVYTGASVSLNGRTVSLLTNTTGSYPVLDTTSPVLTYFLRQGSLYAQNVNSTGVPNNSGLVGQLDLVSAYNNANGHGGLYAFVFRNTTAGATGTKKWELRNPTNDGVYQLYNNGTANQYGDFVACNVSGGYAYDGYDEIYYYTYIGTIQVPVGCQVLTSLTSFVAPIKN